MKFADYIEIIKDAVAHGGYDYFHRSLCEPSHGAKLHVLDGGLLPDGDERIAKEWQRISLRKVKCCISHTVQVRGGLTCARLPTTM